jgi:hypothetical protein
MRHRGDSLRDPNLNLIRYSFMANVEGWRNPVTVRMVTGQIFRFDQRMECPIPFPHSIS